ncbi:helix-turn-helix domain-containing protein [Enterococcus mediterraneensis]|uniref:helix-turn-helix domain-containing protein n=1 Tax=Enterococcus mediterraneensis TaxID=2364791 RepID=UPI000F06552D|nr:helix-turn-helix transcriptional regulator [Enterococcus mediterraneensis]
MQLHEKLRQLRKDSGYSQVALSKLLELNSRTVRRYESADIEPSKAQLQVLADFYNVPLGYLLSTDNTVLDYAKSIADSLTETDRMKLLEYLQKK